MVSVTNVDQNIINPINFPLFDMEGVNKWCLLRSDPFTGTVERLYLTGNRVHIYTDLIDLTNTIQFTMLNILTWHVASKDKYKQWKHQPDEHFND